jgi:hypothetical protein
MRNVQTRIEGTKLHLIVDLEAHGEGSKSGKSVVIGTTEGNKSITVPGAEAVMVGLNVYRKVS